MAESAGADPMYGIKLVESNLSFPFEYIFARGLRAHEAWLREVGADGLQITPVASPLVRRIARYGAAWENYDRNHAPVEARGPTGHLGHDLIDRALDVPAPKRGYAAEAIRQLVHSVHQSFRDEVEDSGPAALFFPRWPESVQQMRYIQRATGKDLLAVLYPTFRQRMPVDYTDSKSDADENPELVYAPFLVNTVQPKSEHFNLWGLTEYSGIKRFARSCGSMAFRTLPWTWRICRASKTRLPYVNGWRPPDSSGRCTFRWDVKMRQSAIRLSRKRPSRLTGLL